MDEQKTPQKIGNQMAAGSDEAIKMMAESFDMLLSAADVQAVYGEALETDDTVVIPAAEVFSAMGVAAGSGYGGASEDDEGGSGSGGGGLGRTFSRPVAVVVVSKEGVRVEPVFDFTKIFLAALTTAAFMTGMVMRFLNPKDTLKKMGEGKF